MPGRHDEVPA